MKKEISKQFISQIKHKIDWDLVSKGLGISLKSTKKCFNDGRFMGRYGEFLLAEKTNSTRVKSEGEPYDIDSSDGAKIEVRSITKQISFAAAKEVGYGRKVTEEGFQDKLDSVDTFVGLHFRNKENPDLMMDEIKFIEITKDMIRGMDNQGILRKNKSVNANKFHKFIENQ